MKKATMVDRGLEQALRQPICIESLLFAVVVSWSWFCWILPYWWMGRFFLQQWTGKVNRSVGGKGTNPWHQDSGGWSSVPPNTEPINNRTYRFLFLTCTNLVLFLAHQSFSMQKCRTNRILLSVETDYPALPGGEHFWLLIVLVFVRG